MPSRLDRTNTEVDVTFWHLLKLREVGVQRSVLISALDPYWVGHVWLDCASGLWFRWPGLQLNILPLFLSPPLTSCLSELLSPIQPSSYTVSNLISHIYHSPFLTKKCPCSESVLSLKGFTSGWCFPCPSLTSFAALWALIQPEELLKPLKWK